MHLFLLIYCDVGSKTFEGDLGTDFHDYLYHLHLYVIKSTLSIKRN